MKNPIRSQMGGTSALQGFDYQKKFIAFLALDLLKKEHHIKRITCEHLDDIEVEQDSKMIYYQIKSTISPSLSKSAIIESIKSFSSIEALDEKKYNEYVMVSNANIRNIHNDDMVKRPFSYLDDAIKNEIKD